MDEVTLVRCSKLHYIYSSIVNYISIFLVAVRFEADKIEFTPLEYWL